MRPVSKIAELLLLAGALAWCGSVRAGECAGDPGRNCEHESGPSSLPLTVYRNFLLVAEAQVLGAPGSWNFILDTGTAPSIVNERLVNQLGLKTLPSGLTIVGKTVPTRVAILPEIALGPIHAASLPVQVQNLSTLERAFGFPIAGILGLDVLGRASFRLDYNKREIEFGEINHRGTPVQLDLRAGIAVAEVIVNGKRARMLVDTGTDRVVLFGGNFNQVGWLEPQETSQSGASLADPQMRIQVFSAPQIVLGGGHFSASRAYLIPGDSDLAFDGLLGPRAIGLLGLSYDKADGLVYLEK